MGIGPFRSESHRQLFSQKVGVPGTGVVAVRTVEVPLPNPDPERFKVERVHGIGSYACALVHYPDATNFEGRKVIVFKGTTEEAISEATTLDPHFAEDGNIVARFRPDEEGWQDALVFAMIKAAADPRTE